MARKVTLTDLFMWLLIILFIFVIISEILDFEVSHLIVVGISLFSVVFSTRNLNRKKILALLFLFFFFAYGVMGVLITGGGIGGIYSIISGIIVFLAFREGNISRTQLMTMAFSMFFADVYFISITPGYYNTFMYARWVGDDESILNSNILGILICYLTILLLVIIGESKRKTVRFAKCAFYLLAAWGIWNARSRMALVIFILFPIINLIFRKWKFDKNVFLRILYLVAVICEVGFPIVYLWMYSRNYAMSLKSFGLSTKSFYTGREQIWLKALNAMNSAVDWLFGIGSKQDFWRDNVLNMHNNAMNLLVVVGLFGMVVYYVFLFQLIFKGYDANKKNAWQNQMLIFFICVIVEGMTDITLFYNNFLLFIFLPLGLACNVRIQESEKQIKGYRT